MTRRYPRAKVFAKESSLPHLTCSCILSRLSRRQKSPPYCLTFLCGWLPSAPTPPEPPGPQRCRRSSAASGNRARLVQWEPTEISPHISSRLRIPRSSSHSRWTRAQTRAPVVWTWWLGFSVALRRSAYAVLQLPTIMRKLRFCRGISVPLPNQSNNAPRFLGNYRFPGSPVLRFQFSSFQFRVSSTVPARHSRHVASPDSGHVQWTFTQVVQPVCSQPVREEENETTVCFSRCFSTARGIPCSRATC